MDHTPGHGGVLVLGALPLPFASFLSDLGVSSQERLARTSSSDDRSDRERFSPGSSRRLPIVGSIPARTAYPIDLSSLDDITVVRKAFLRSMPKIGQQPGAKGGGNARKRARLVISLPGVWSVVTLVDTIAVGGPPPDQQARAAEATA